jgi:TonB dependent receptor
VLSTTQSTSSSVQTFTLGAADLITPSLSNEVRANYSNQRLSSKYRLDNFGGAVPLPDSAMYASGFSSANGLFQLAILGAGELANGPFGIDEQRQVNLIDNLSVTKAGHQLKFGVDYRWLSPFSIPNAYAQFGEFSGVTACATQPCTQKPGYALSGTAVFADTNAAQSSALLAENFSFYGQDTWKLTPRLTLTYGLRWDINPALKGKNLANQPFTVINLNDPANLALAPRGTPLYETRYGNVAPRISVAYQLGGAPNWARVLRGGFGIFYDLGYGSLGGSSSYFPFGGLKIIAPSPMPCASGFTGICFPLNAAQAAPPALTTNPPVSGIVVADPQLKAPRTYEWNVALEQSLGSSQSISFTYIGADGRDLLRVTSLYNPNANFLSVSVTTNTASSYYDALQIKFQRRFSHGLQALASYTFSHSTDIASTDAFANYLNTPGGGSYQNSDKGDSDFDIRHSFTLGATYELPVPGSQRVVQAAFGGWSLDSFVIARSAPPVDVIGAFYTASGTPLYPRPNVNPGVPLVLYGSQYAGGKIFNKAAFTPAQKGQQGNFGRNVLRGFGATQADVGFQRQFHLTEGLGLRLRSEFFNLFNHPNFGNPNNSLAGCPQSCNPLFGHSTQTLASSLGSGGANGGFNPLYQIGGPRSIQLALKLQF